LINAGFTLPSDCLHDPKFNGLSAETIYAQLGKQNPQSGQGQGNGQGQGEPSTGNVQDAPKDGTGNGNGQGQPMSGQDWQIAANQATAACKGSGKMPNGLAETVKANQQVPEDWRAILAEFIEHTVPSDYSWTSPNRRHIANGLYLPGMKKENLGHVVMAVDTSASIDTRLLGIFARELNGIMSEAKPEHVTVIYCDAHVNRVQEFDSDSPIDLEATGRGGTRFNPVFDYVAEHGISPVCLIYFTDLDNGLETVAEPSYPVLWSTGMSVSKVAEFGRTVRVNEFD
jgi:predicted metal-dependent peptidase